MNENEVFEIIKNKGLFDEEIANEYNNFIWHLNDMRKKHKEQKWYSKGNIKDEGILWLIEVSYNYDSHRKIDAELEFFKKRIYYYQDILNQEHHLLDYKDMNILELESYFNRSNSSIKKTIQKLMLEHSSYKYYDDGKTYIKSEGVKFIEENYYKREYLKRLENLHLDLKKQLGNEG